MKKKPPSPPTPEPSSTLPLQHHLVRHHEAGVRLDRFLSQVFDGLSRQEARRRISAGRVTLNGRPVRVLARKVRAGDRLSLAPPETTPTTKNKNDPSPHDPSSSPTTSPLADSSPPNDVPLKQKATSPARNAPSSRQTTSSPASPPPSSKRKTGPSTQTGPSALEEVLATLPPLELLYRDRHLAIINKPPNIPIEPTRHEDLRTCLRQVEALLRDEGVRGRRFFVAAAHRLDAAASGAVAFALSKSAAKGLGQQFAQHTASRHYLALVVGLPLVAERELRHHLARTGPGLRQGVVAPDKGRLAITHYRISQRFNQATLLDVQILTGRTHQIRVHLCHYGHPILGDPLYGARILSASPLPRPPRLLLHAATLQLQHPLSGETILVEAPLPPDFQLYLEQLHQDKETVD